MPFIPPVKPPYLIPLHHAPTNHLRPRLPAAEASLLFGRGMRAGIDRREQKKTAAKLENASLALMRKAEGLEDTTETRACVASLGYCLHDAVFHTVPPNPTCYLKHV